MPSATLYTSLSLKNIPLNRPCGSPRSFLAAFTKLSMRPVSRLRFKFAVAVTRRLVASRAAQNPPVGFTLPMRGMAMG